ncbi:response regulator [Pelagibacterium limicola]|uniref:response regulator n=1 Tax=Pelagibacterium limicola TaxID=2791022 RepID=UPI0018B0057D|nr:response regulator [Pelagibacterium limicola]
MTESPHDEKKLTLLVVEDDFLIGFDLKRTLQEAGHRVIGPARKVSEALEILKTQSPDAAILDVNLYGERVSPVARLLHVMGIPFVLTSADEDFIRGDDALSASENFGKPTDTKRLLASLHALGETGR